jgi:transposase
LKDFGGVLQGDAFAGYNEAYTSGRVLEAACWAHVRHNIYDIHASRPTPLTTHFLEQVALLYEIEADIRGKPPDVRQTILYSLMATARLNDKSRPDGFSLELVGVLPVR